MQTSHRQKNKHRVPGLPMLQSTVIHNVFATNVGTARKKNKQTEVPNYPCLFANIESHTLTFPFSI